MPVAPSCPRPTASLLGAQAPIGYFFMSLVAADRGRLSKELEEDADCPDQAFQAHLNKRRPAPEAGTGTGL
jgi:hypothetical protein